MWELFYRERTSRELAHTWVSEDGFEVSDTAPSSGALSTICASGSDRLDSIPTSGIKHFFDTG